MVHVTMNYMKTQELQKLYLLSVVVGDFIRYWGFRKIHGQIWTILYLTGKPLSGVEITSALKVSKALVSPALQELQKDGLIVEVISENSKTKRYQAVENVTEIIQKVLRRRELPMMEKISARFKDVSEDSSSLDASRVDKLSSLIQTAHFSLLALVESDDIWK